MRAKIILGLGVLVLLVAALAAATVLLVPADYLASKERAFLFGFLSSVVVASISAAGAHFSQRFLDRPVVRIEHVDLKSERVPFTLDADLWWRLTHGGIVSFIDKRVAWSVTCFDKNEFSYHHLQDMHEVIDQLINKYHGTAEWTRSLIERLNQYGESADANLRNEILSDLSPDIVKFEEHYRETRKSSLYKDLVNKPTEVAEFMVSEANGLLLMHERELKSFREFKAWMGKRLAEGESSPKAVDHKDRKTPTISLVVGVTNVGRTPALVRFEAVFRHDEQDVPIRLTSKNYQYYAKIDPNEVSPLLFEVDQNKCGFELCNTVYEALTSKENRSRGDLVLSLADGQQVRKKRIPLLDNSTLPV